ncbi:MAG: outer membrane protein assembly factor BamA [Planctomycetota bacterium]
MRRAILSCLVIWLLGTLNASAQGERPAPAGDRRIKDVVIEGLVHFDAATILSTIQTQKGGLYRKEVVADDIRFLGETYFQDVQVSTENVGEDEVVVVFQVAEWLRYRRVRFEGLSAFERREILDEVSIAEGGPLTGYALTRWKRDIEEFYREEGYHFVEVTQRIEGDRAIDGPGVEVVLHVVEGPEVVVSKISFEGNLSVTSDDLEEVMDLQVETFFSSGTYVEKTLEVDLVALRQHYRDRGFPEARISLYDRRFSPSREEVELYFIVQEGPRYYIENILFLGNLAVSDAELRELIETEEGDPLARRFLAEDAERIKKLYKERAYIECQVGFDEPLFGMTGNLATVVFRIEENKKHYIRDVVIEGNRVTRDDVVRREISLFPGDEFNWEELNRSFTRLYGLQYFNNAQGFPYINLDPRPVEDGWQPRSVPEEEEDVEIQWDDLVVQVEEGQVSQFRFVVGIGSDNGLIGGVELVRRNFDLGNLPSSFGSTLSETIDGLAFTGGGQTLTLAVTPGTELTTFRFGFQEPYLFGSNYALDLDVSRALRRFRRYDLERTSLDVGISRRLTRELAVGVGIRNDRIDVDDIDTLLLEPLDNIEMDPNPDFLLDRSILPEPIWAARGKSSVRALRAFTSYNTVDNPFLPTKGLNLGLSYEWAPKLLGSRFQNFSRANVEGEWFGPIYESVEGRRIVLGLRGGFGWAEENGGDDRVPFYEQFFAGGRSSIRGFAFQGVGPRQFDQAVGGNALILGGAEISFPLFGDFDARQNRYEEYVRGVLFADTGTLAPDIQSPELGRFRLAVGAGIRIKIPFLGPVPFALDFGIPITYWDDRAAIDEFGRLVRVEGDRRQVFSFSFGRRF